MRRCPSNLAILLLIALSVQFNPAVSQGQVQVGITTVIDGREDSAQRKLFTGSNGEQWAFYFTGTNIEYASSLNGALWSTRGTLPYPTSDFSLTIKSVLGTDYVVVAIRSGFDIVVRRGVISPGSVSFGSEETALDGTSPSNSYQAPSIAVSGNDHVWIAALLIGDSFLTEDDRQVVARRSTSRVDGDLSLWQDTSLLGKADSSTRNVVMLPRTGDAMYLLVSGLSNNVVGYGYDGSAWSDGNSGGDRGWYHFPGTIFDGRVNSVAIAGDFVYVGGTFLAGGGNNDVNRIGLWHASSWKALATGLDNTVWAMALSGTGLYVGGMFAAAGGSPNGSGVGYWTGSTWEALGSGITGTVYALLPSSGFLYVGGSFTDVGGNTAADRVAAWDGATWLAIGSGINNNQVNALSTSGGTIYVGGSFIDAGGNGLADGLATWNGATWTALGGGLNNTVNSLLPWGDRMYVGGAFTDAGTDPNADRIAAWNGTTWLSLATGLGSAGTAVEALILHNGTLYAGGDFRDVGGNTTQDSMALWTGSTWQGTNLIDNSFYSTAYKITSLASYGDRLYAGGTFEITGAPSISDASVNGHTRRVAAYDGSTWYSLGQTRGLVVRSPDVLETIDNSVYVEGFELDPARNKFFGAGLRRWSGTTYAMVNQDGHPNAII